MSKEKLYYRGRQHPIVFLWPTLLLLVSFILYLNYYVLTEVSMILSVLALVWFAMNGLTYLVTSIEVTNYRVTFKSGIIVRRVKDFQMNRIEGVKVRQTLLGEFLGYGTLIIMGTGGTQNAFIAITEPKRVRQCISRQIHQTQSRDN